MGFAGKLSGGEWEAAGVTEVGGRISEVSIQRTDIRGHPSEIRFAVTDVNLTWQAVVNEFHRAGRTEIVKCK